MQILIISGQSSVLQNATALSTACHAASKGLRVLLVGTGPTGLLGEFLNQELKANPVEIGTNLAAMELVTIDEFNRRWEMLCKEPRYGVTGRMQDVQPDEIPSFPGMDEIASLIVADRAARTGQFDLLVFGGTTFDSLIRGITLRETIRWVVRLVSGLDRGPGASRTSQDTAILPGSILNTLSSAGLLQDLRVGLEQFLLWFASSTGTRVRLVMPSEEMTLANMRYALNGFGLYGMEVDTIFAHGQEEHINATVKEALSSRIITDTIPITPATIEEWAQRGEQLYSKRTDGLGISVPDEPAPVPPPLKDQNEVRLHMPLLDAKSLDIGIASEEVVVRLGPFRRHILVKGLERGGKLRAKIEGETLRLWVE